jgi:hypothetical protein
VLRTGFASDKRFLAAFVIILSACWLGFHWRSLGFDWNWDDYHLVRSFTGQELARVFTGTWDVDGLETDGFRPFTVAFNHFRSVLIGEHPAGQRLLLLAMMTGLLWVVGWICLQFRIGRDATALALLILASTKAFSGDIVWIADGVHVFQNLLMAVSVAAALLVVRDRSLVWGLVSLAAAWVAIWTREDSLTLVLMLPVLLVAYHCLASGVRGPGEFVAQSGKKPFNARYAAYVVGLAGVTLFTLIYRAAVIPSAQPLSFNVGAVRGLLDHLSWSMALVGQSLPAGWVHGLGYQSGSPLLDQITRLWWGALATVAVFALFFLQKDRSYWVQAALCIVCMIIASMPGMVTARGNLIFWPTFFFALLLAITLVRIWSTAAAFNQVESIVRVSLGKRSYNGVHVWAVVVCLLAVVGSLGRAVIQDLDQHPLSLGQIWRDYDIIYGTGSQFTLTIPEERRRSLIRKLENLGLTAESAAEENVRLTYFRNAYRRALANERFYPHSDYAEPFVAPANFLSP